MQRKKGYFSISAVAKMFSVHQQTIRLYEKEGLISPKRSEGNTRLFSEEDIDRLEEIIYLTHKLGINLAGVEMILKLKRQISKLQRDMNKAFEQTQEELDKHTETAKTSAHESMKQLISLKAEAKPTAQRPLIPRPQEVTQEELENMENWDIEYEDE